MCQIVPVCSLFSSNSSQLCSKCITLSLPCCRSRLACKSSRSLKFRRGWVFGCFASVLFPNTQSIRDRKRSPSCRSLVEFKQPQQPPPSFIFFYFVTWVLVQFLELTLRCWHEILHCKAKAALTSCRGPRVYMRVRVSVCECVSPSSPATGVMNMEELLALFSHSHAASNQRWERRSGSGAAAPARLDSNPEPALYLLRPRPAQVEVKWCWLGGGVALTGVGRPQTDSYKIWITHLDWKSQIPMDSICFTTWFCSYLYLTFFAVNI